MARTDSTEIGLVIDVDSDISLTPFISAANALVTKFCTNLDIDYVAAHLIIIETWLAAHFYTVRDMRAESEKAGTVGEKFQSKVDLGFSTSHYGQMAMRLDYYGGLAALDRRIMKGVRAPAMNWLGKKEDEMGTTLGD